ncbi:hypothetical protein E8E11_009505 [Didymella keratinophila]|nr:hypothetical protein E8E11_009505 [Didymella keratinophila]
MRSTFSANSPRARSKGSQNEEGSTTSSAPAIGPDGTHQFQIQNTAPGHSHSEELMTFLDPDVLTARSMPRPQSLELLDTADVGFHTTAPLTQNDLLDPGFPFQGLGQLSAEVNTQSYAQDYGPPLWNINYFLEDYMNSLPTTPVMPSDLGLILDATVEDNPAEPLVLEDEREQISMLFLMTTCHNLSIEEDSDENPWKTVIWPMAQEHPALYHALAALTCFHTSKAQPQLRIEGQRHLHTSAHLLSVGINKSEIPLDAALAATLALGFAETWDSESTATGMTHITGAGILLQQMLQNRTIGVYSQQEEARLEFLYNTWTYMDVIARFTCLDLCPPVPDTLVVATVGRLNINTSKLDPLMGYATTFFPIMRRVADLIRRVRVKNAPRNSPVIISQALELKRSIEDWTPPIDLEFIEDHSQLVTDAIQTAEAYRWSILSLLYQAVPELPNQTSYGELAQKILVYIATIPLSSPTIIIHILPLIIAGNDAVEEEDRDFVRDRWRAMSKRLVTGIVERALDITNEVWKRRDEYWQARSLSRLSEDARQPEGISTTNNLNYGTGSGAASSNTGGHPVNALNARLQNRKANPFPVSAAFKKGVDTITRSGCIDYTVRGNLHWLGVMKDWQWQELDTMAQPTSLDAHLSSVLSPHPNRTALAREVIPTLLKTLPKIAHALRTTSVSAAGSSNSFGDDQLNVDVLAEDLIRDAIASVPSIVTASSEEDPIEKPAYQGTSASDERYTIAFDPLDGSSIIGPNWTVGTIIGIWDGTSAVSDTATPRARQVASILGVLGPRTSAVVAVRVPESGDSGSGNVFECALTDDGTVEVLRSRVTLNDAPKTRYFAPANLRCAAENEKYAALVNQFIQRKYTLRYSGGLVPDVYHALVKGHGIYTSPVTEKSPAKLRRLYELAPIALLVECAGGVALDSADGTHVLDRPVKDTDERGGLVCGNKEDVEFFEPLKRASITQRLKEWSSCDISDGLVELGHQYEGHLDGLTMYSPGLQTEAKIIGPAYTGKFVPNSHADAPKPKGNYVCCILKPFIPVEATSCIKLIRYERMW